MRGKTDIRADGGRKKILLISYHFPPNSAVGGARAANFAKRLPDYGFDTLVLTVKDRYIERIDTERLKGVEKIRVIKAGKLPRVTQLVLALRPWKKRSASAKQAPAPAIATPPSPGSESIKDRLRRYIKSFLMLPDLERNWILPVFLKGFKAIRSEKIDCIISSCPPYSAHLAALLLKAATGVRWVADFRDPWMITGSKRLYQTCALSLMIDRWMERTVIRNADMAMFNTLKMRDEYEKRYGGGVKKFLYVPNGFSPEEFSFLKGLGKYDRFTLTHAGSLYMGRTPEPVFMAVKRLIDDGKVRPEDINIKLVGGGALLNGRPADQVISSYGLSSVVEVVETVPYRKALEMIGRSHLALLLAPEQPYQVPAKVYDYMGSGTGILALAGEGATYDMINAADAGRAFHPADIKGIADFIYDCFTGKEPLGRDNPALRQLHVSTVAEGLARQIEGLI